MPVPDPPEDPSDRPGGSVDPASGDRAGGGARRGVAVDAGASRGRFVETFTGGRFDPFDPSPEAVRLEDIAGGLAHTCRFGGHCRRFYSVALHSLHVSVELEDEGRRLAAYGLLHDAGEAYLGDVPRPVKAAFDGLERAEARIREAVWEAVGLPAPSTDEWATVRAADDRLLAYEAGELLVDGSWADDPPALDYDLDVGPAETVRRRFLDRASALLPRAPTER